MKPVYIPVEGLDGGGKSTLIKTVHEILGENTRVVREPGGTPMGEAIRALTKRTDFSEVINNGTDQLLMAASRSQSLSTVVAPALRDGINVIGDRCYWSTLAYNCPTQVMFEQYWALHEIYGKPYADPDLYIYVDVEPAVGLARVRSRNEPDRYEARGVEYFQRVREQYGRLVMFIDKPVIVIDGNRPLSDSVEKLKRVLPEYLARLDDNIPIGLSNEDREIITKIFPIANQW